MGHLSLFDPYVGIKLYGSLQTMFIHIVYQFFINERSGGGGGVGYYWHVQFLRFEAERNYIIVQ